MRKGTLFDIKTHGALSATKVLATLLLTLNTCLAWGGLLDGVRDLLDGPHIAHRYAELKEDFYPTSIAWSSDGKYIASTGTHTRTISIWDVEQRRIVHSVELPVPNSPSFSYSLTWSPDGRYLASCAGFPAELGMRVWDVHTWQVIKDFNLASGVYGCRSPAFSRDGQLLVVGRGDGVSIYSTQTWQLQKLWKIPRDMARTIQQIALSPDGKTVAIAENGYWNDRPETHIVFWDLIENLPGRDFVAYLGVSNSVDNLAFSPDGHRLATATQTFALSPQTVRVWNVADNSLVRAPLDGLEFGKVSALAYTLDGKYLIVTPRKDGTIRLLNAQTLRIADTVPASDPVNGITIHPSSSLFGVAAGQSIVIWSLANNK